MKKKLFLLEIFLFLLALPVYAETYELNTLIPVDTVATVHTEKFDYNELVFSSQLDEKGNSVLRFSSIHNKTVSKVPVSINVLLFNQDKTNVGFLTYCTDRDFSSQYSGFKLSSGQTAPFSIEVTSRYFSNDKSAKDVFYIAVMDENKYCQVGGYDKYIGQTLEEIVGVDSPKAENPIAQFISKLMENSAAQILIIIVIVSLVVLFIFGILLNSLHRKMYGKATILAYLPVANLFVATRLAFGKIVAIVYIIFYLISIGLYAFGITIILPIMSLAAILAILVVIIKLITKKYDLFYFEPGMSYNVDNSPVDNSDFSSNTTESVQPTLDLSYSNSSLEEDDLGELDVSLGEERSESPTVPENTNESNDETDLSKLFH